MSIPDVVEALRGVQFLHDVDEEQLLSIAAIAALEEYPSGFVLFRAGQPHQNVYLVVKGIAALEVRVASQVVKRLQTVGEGELLGWSPHVWARSEMTATARALQADPGDRDRCQPARWPSASTNPKFGFEFMQRTAQALLERLTAHAAPAYSTSTATNCPAVATGEEV